MGTRSTWKIVVGIIAVVIGLPMLIAGIAIAVVFGPDGRFTSGSERVETTGSALVSTPLEIVDSVPGKGLSGVELQLELQSTSGGPVFIGVGPEADVSRFLEGVAYERIDDFDFDPFRYNTTPVAGDRVAEAPSTQSFWVARAEGAGEQTLNWEIEDGTFQLVVMNADGAASVTVDGRFGIEIPWIFPVGLIVLIVGALILAGGILLIVFGARRRPAVAGPSPYAAQPVGATATPPPPPTGPLPPAGPPPTGPPPPTAPPPP